MSINSLGFHKRTNQGKHGANCQVPVRSACALHDQTAWMSGLLGVYSFLHTVLSMAENVANSIRILVLDYEIVQELF